MAFGTDARGALRSTIENNLMEARRVVQLQDTQVTRTLFLMLQDRHESGESTDDTDPGGEQWNPEFRYPKRFHFESPRFFLVYKCAEIKSSRNVEELRSTQLDIPIFQISGRRDVDIEPRSLGKNPVTEIGFYAEFGSDEILLSRSYCKCVFWDLGNGLSGLRHRKLKLCLITFML